MLSPFSNTHLYTVIQFANQQYVKSLLNFLKNIYILALKLHFVKNFRYIILFVMTLVIILLWPKKGVSFSYFREFVRNLRNVIKEKDEDEGFQYETIWDADGMMHLIKKPSEAPPRCSSEAASVGRYIKSLQLNACIYCPSECF